jgi:hypothetical protein
MLMKMHPPIKRLMKNIHSTLNKMYPIGSPIVGLQTVLFPFARPSVASSRDLPARRQDHSSMRSRSSYKRRIIIYKIHRL